MSIYGDYVTVIYTLESPGLLTPNSWFCTVQNLSSTAAIIDTTGFNIAVTLEFCPTPKHNVCVFCMVLTTNSDRFRIRQNLRYAVSQKATTVDSPGCEAMFRRNLLPPSSGWKRKPTIEMWYACSARDDDS
jgi:hypothetical protein